jgi:hypothetical protein
MTLKLLHFSHIYEENFILLFISVSSATGVSNALVFPAVVGVPAVA